MKFVLVGRTIRYRHDDFESYIESLTFRSAPNTRATGTTTSRSGVVIPTNLSFIEQATVFGDAKMTTALLDRLTHRCYILETGNDCFRFKASSAAATRKMKEVKHALTPA